MWTDQRLSGLMCAHTSRWQFMRAGNALFVSFSLPDISRQCYPVASEATAVIPVRIPGPHVHLAYFWPGLQGFVQRLSGTIRVRRFGLSTPGLRFQARALVCRNKWTENLPARGIPGRCNIAAFVRPINELAPILPAVTDA